MRSQPPLDRATVETLRRSLEDGERFAKLVRLFIENTIADGQFGDEESRRFQRNSLIAISGDCTQAIIDGARSPIERIFLRALLVSFLQSDGAGLIVHPTTRDASAEVASFRSIVAQFVSLGAVFRKKDSSQDLRQFLDGEMSRAHIAFEHRRHFLRLLMRYYYAPLEGNFHVTLQPCFPNVVDSAPIRPDFYFWNPKHPDINVIVECDGFEFHSTKERFKSDRQRDRAFKARGYDVLRFSGSEIVGDPLGAASELADYLWRRVSVADQTEKREERSLLQTRKGAARRI